MSGTGAALYGGRWNPKGVEVVYAAQSISLAMLEVLVHETELPSDYAVSKATISAQVSVEAPGRKILPKGWRNASGSAAAKRFGKRWVEEARSAVLAVPSSIVTSERIYVLNPAHPDFVFIKFGKQIRHVFDARLR